MKNLHVTTQEKYTKHSEGDVWVENGKTWTIKNGIKRTVTKMDEARKEVYIPLACPSCKGPMKHHLDEKMWTIHKTCFNCVIDMEHEIMKSGKWREYEKAKIAANADSFLKDLKGYFEDIYQDNYSKAHVTEDGMIEKWKDVDVKHVKEIGETVINEIETKINEYKEN